MNNGKTFWKQVRDKSITALVTLTIGAVGILIVFAFDTYEVVTKTVPEMKKEFAVLEDTVKKAEARQVRIEGEVIQMKQSIKNINTDIEAINLLIKENADKQQDDMQKILLLLIDIKDK